ncbi:MAG: ATP-binding protein, partial [Armatimonadota bacterium]|nr:ATP-binding protein [Armatimonadota bacterium]
VLDAVLEILRPSMEAKRQSYSQHLPDDLPRLLADPERLHQVMQNLLTNAHKYTPEGGRIWVEARQEGDRVRVAVHDTGIGLSEEDKRHVFTKFFRVQRPETAEIAGTGLGLAIVQTIIQVHGGEVFVESQLNVGSTFGFYLPAAP